nr:pectinesterase/pectinesterase inhibitor U1 [Tanacetum cinerariifolium]
MAGVSNNNRKKLILGALATVLLISAFIGIVVGVKSRNSGSHNSNVQSITDSEAHEIVKSSCSATFYPELCYSTIASHPEVSTKVKTQKDAIELAVSMTTKAVKLSYVKIQKLSKRRGLSPRQMRGLNDCLEMVSETLDELGQVTKDLEEYDTKKSL